MLDGINTGSPSIPGAKGNAASPTTAPSGTGQQKDGVTEVRQVKDSETRNVSSVIEKSADERLFALASGRIQDFLTAAEKLIDASLPSKPPGTRLRIDLDDETGRFVYKGIDIETGDVVNQFPADEILKYLSFMREREGLEGIVVDEEV